MFTGIIYGIGKLVSLDKAKDPVLTLDIDFKKNLRKGDSVAVNGACLTIIDIKGSIYKFNVSSETFKKTNFSDLKKGDLLNTELPVTPETMLGGHIVSGHIDGTARLRRVEKSKGSTTFSFTYGERKWNKFLISKGSVSVNGISLTISETFSSFFSVEVIPLTLQKTNLRTLKIGERVNIELDLIGKYLYNFILKKI